MHSLQFHGSPTKLLSGKGGCGRESTDGGVHARAGIRLSPPYSGHR